MKPGNGLLPALLLWLLLGIGASADSTRPSVERLTVCGDSLAVGLGRAVRSIPHEGTTVRVYAQEGTTAQYWLRRIGVVTATRPQLVLVSLGVNDLVGTTGDAEIAFRARAKTIDNELRAVGARVVWLVPTWVAWSSRIESQLAAIGVEYLAQGLTEGPAPRDGIHPTADQYRGWATAIMQRIGR